MKTTIDLLEDGLRAQLAARKQSRPRKPARIRWIGSRRPPAGPGRGGPLLDARLAATAAMIALDTNLLVYARRTAVPEHRRARRALEQVAGAHEIWTHDAGFVSVRGVRVHDPL